MESINTLFHEVKSDKKKRKIRSDKLIDVKFPVTENQRIVLKNKAREIGYRENVSKSNTFIFHNAILLVKEHPDWFEERSDYHAKENTMVVKLNEYYYEQCLECSNQWGGISLRKTVHRVMMTMIERGMI